MKACIELGASFWSVSNLVRSSLLGLTDYFVARAFPRSELGARRSKWKQFLLIMDEICQISTSKAYSLQFWSLNMSWVRCKGVIDVNWSYTLNINIWRLYASRLNDFTIFSAERWLSLYVSSDYICFDSLVTSSNDFWSRMLSSSHIQGGLQSTIFWPDLGDVTRYMSLWSSFKSFYTIEIIK